jgi:hypothetical protein
MLLLSVTIPSNRSRILLNAVHHHHDPPRCCAMTHPSSSATSSGHYDLSPSFEAAIAQIELPPVAIHAHDVGEEERPPKKRRVAFRDDAEEIKVYNEVENPVHQREGHELELDQAEDADDSEAGGNEGLPRLSSSYLEDQAYNASKFGGFAEYFRHRRIKL